MHRVALDAEHELPRFDLGEIENVVDQPKQVLAVLLHSVQHLRRLGREFAVQTVLHELGITEDGIERRPELMAHVGEELRLVLARQFELPGSYLRSPGTGVRSGWRALTAMQTTASDQ